MAHQKTFKDYIVENKETEAEIESTSVPVDLEEIASTPIVEDHQNDNKILYESIIQTNTQLLKTAEMLLEHSQATNKNLVESVTKLAKQISKLERKIEESRDIEIPTPIVNLTLPNSRIKKEVHRDNKGLITHITEEIVADSEEQLDD